MILCNTGTDSKWHTYRLCSVRDNSVVTVSGPWWAPVNNMECSTCYLLALQVVLVKPTEVGYYIFSSKWHVGVLFFRARTRRNPERQPTMWPRRPMGPSHTPLCFTVVRLVKTWASSSWTCGESWSHTRQSPWRSVSEFNFYSCALNNYWFIFVINNYFCLIALKLSKECDGWAQMMTVYELTVQWCLFKVNALMSLCSNHVILFQTVALWGCPLGISLAVPNVTCAFLFEPDQEKECAERLCNRRRTTGSDTLHDLQQDTQQSQHGKLWCHQTFSGSLRTLTPFTNSSLVLSETGASSQRSHASFQGAQGK